jgi:hypothetical protein
LQLPGQVIRVEEPPVSWARGYSRANGETSSFLGHPSYDAAVADAQACFTSRGVLSAWVRPVFPEMRLGGVVWFVGLDPRVPR